MRNLKPIPGQVYVLQTGECTSECRRIVVVKTEHWQGTEPTYFVGFDKRDGRGTYWNDRTLWERWVCEAKLVDAAPREVHDTGSSTHSLSQ